MNDIISTEKARRRRQSEASTPALPESKLAFSIAEWVVASGLKRTFTYGEIKAGRLPAKKAGSRTIITRPAGEAYLEALPDVVPEAADAS